MKNYAHEVGVSQTNGSDTVQDRFSLRKTQP